MAWLTFLTLLENLNSSSEILKVHGDLELSCYPHCPPSLQFWQLQAKAWPSLALWIWFLPLDETAQRLVVTPSLGHPHPIMFHLCKMHFDLFTTAWVHLVHTPLVNHWKCSPVRTLKCHQREHTVQQGPSAAIPHTSEMHSTQGRSAHAHTPHPQ